MKNEILENRLIDFAVKVSVICQSIKHTDLGFYLSKQLIRSSLSPALNYGEAQGAESKKDFIHKLRISLKELRESYVSIRVIERAELTIDKEEILKVKDECNQLISIFVTSIKTAERKLYQ